MLPIIQEKQLLPQEMEVWYILPAIRKELARALVDLGLSQKNIATILNITQAAVSQYKKDKRANTLQFDEATKREIMRTATRIKSHPETIFKEIMHIDNYLKQNGIFCKLHKQKSATPEGCEQVCQQNFFGGNHA